MRTIPYVLPMLGLAFSWYVSAQEDLLAFSPGVSDFQLAGEGFSPEIWISANDYKGVQRTANDLADDFGRVVGLNGTVTVVESSSDSNGTTDSVIIAGTIGQSTLIDSLISSSLIDVSETEGQWEAYTSSVVEDPVPGVAWALIVAGSDQRGTIYGLYDISEQMGVSPWYWWADVPVKTKASIWVRDEPKIQGAPSIKYRGFFINDESPALTGWASGKFKKSEYGSDFTAEFYKLVFELLLRLKANYMWPAMWSSMFYVDDPMNGQLATDYGVVMGTSHHEPMARAGNEQGTFMEGDWDWESNRDEIELFFEEGVERSSDWETIYTMGMRGTGDAESPTLTPAALEEIIQAQQSLLEQGLNTTNISDIPQAWVLYKEVGRYYQAGMDVPDSVTLLWTDDNSGNLLRVPLANETDHSAGAGVYYHFDYVGVPRNYKWINSIQLVKTWEQMQLAYEKGVREIWIANIGDIKPLEIPMTHFLDMAYDMSKYTSPDSTTAWIKRWAAQMFDESVADQTAQILNTYGKLIVRRKYELLSDEPFAYSVANYDEAEKVMGEWENLLELAQESYGSLDNETQIPYFQMILHPIMAGKTVVDLYIKAELNSWYASQRRISTNKIADEVYALFAQDSEITDMYHTVNGGKWDHFVNQVHMGYTTWDDPRANIMPNVTYVDSSDVPNAGIMGVSVQGSDLTAPGDPEPTLLSMDPYMPPTEIRYLDIYARDNGTFSYSITANASYVSVSNRNGTLTAPGNNTDIRSVVSVDWDAAPEGLTWVGLDINPTDTDDGWRITAMLPVNKTSVPSSFSGFIESNGAVSIEAEHYVDSGTKDGLSYITIPHYGRTLSGVKLWPVTAASQTPASGPALTYSFYTFTSSNSAQLIVSLGASLNHDPSRPLKFAFAIDDGDAVAVQPVPDTPMGSEPEGWTEAVVAGGWTSSSEIDVSEGEHILTLWLLEPGVVVQKLVVDMGGVKSSSLGPPESLEL